MNDLLNPGNTRTITLTETQLCDLLDCLWDRIERLDELSNDDPHNQWLTTTIADLHGLDAVLDPPT